MSNPQVFQNQPAIQEEYHVPLEYKIVDLPVIHIPQMQTLKTFPCKIYRKVNNNVDNPAEMNYEWKRKCYGRIKFVKMEGKIIVAAYQYASCHIRLRQQPVQNHNLYNLLPSEEYPFNWVYKSSFGAQISISLSQADYMDFKNQWNSAKTNNTKQEAIEWLESISDGLFD